MSLFNTNHWPVFIKFNNKQLSTLHWRRFPDYVMETLHVPLLHMSVISRPLGKIDQQEQTAVQGGGWDAMSLMWVLRQDPSHYCPTKKPHGDPSLDLPMPVSSLDSNTGLCLEGHTAQNCQTTCGALWRGRSKGEQHFCLVIHSSFWLVQKLKKKFFISLYKMLIYIKSLI